MAVKMQHQRVLAKSTMQTDKRLKQTIKIRLDKSILTKSLAVNKMKMILLMLTMVKEQAQYSWNPPIILPKALPDRSKTVIQVQQLRVLKKSTVQTLKRAR